ncbi:putative transmembrane protein [Toxoplasma gondii RUB]|uniref:Transmembrane protein n=12 Tax=Toxoplasma gondii TaxID=5811 RepID=A0A125YIS5_TOXGV|nr:hypothetical protein TGGT1_221905 [Toxoplasma gondii GT1]ESS30055.1 putative transmembrane protein [Toxoplasma gondii VEG]KAF4645604.1 hypothetical protein TGRH88_000900 [Toxoplasma gondii]KFG36306.1 putative transmembrane protein [Toxoplasma gondii p89]KFG41536.1 putative transmembrane protein [Toxoplasma gondii GAB2-2007-GAL-DOM2]KFG47571.1 putative transmembrane protein [Toxoplasma gondii FOU]KFG61122.1 putative transmembrane protein [Toxoplasma gondii RUB]KFH03644.1 putative transmemb
MPPFCTFGLFDNHRLKFKEHLVGGGGTGVAEFPGFPARSEPVFESQCLRYFRHPSLLNLDEEYPKQGFDVFVFRKKLRTVWPPSSSQPDWPSSLGFAAPLLTSPCRVYIPPTQIYANACVIFICVYALALARIRFSACVRSCFREARCFIFDVYAALFCVPAKTFPVSAR